MSTLTQDNKKRQIVQSLYLCKALMAFLIVTRHTTFFCKDALLPIISIATPTFFCITGYFLFSDSQERELSKATRWTRKGLLLCIFMNLIYLLHHSVDAAVYGRTYTPAYKVLEGTAFGDSLIGNFIINIFTGISYSYHLWYLSAFWIAMLIFYVLRRFCPVLIYATPLLYAWAQVCHRWGADIFPGATEPVLIVLRCNFFAMALPFICTGYLISKHSKALLRIPLIPLWLILCGAMLYKSGTVLSYLHINTYGWCYHITTYVMVCFTLLTCLKYSNARVPGLNTIGQHHSANIYYLHILIYMHLNRTGFHTEEVAALIVYLASIPLSIGINRITEGWKYLMSKCSVFALTCRGKNGSSESL